MGGEPVAGQGDDIGPAGLGGHPPGHQNPRCLVGDVGTQSGRGGVTEHRQVQVDGGPWVPARLGGVPAEDARDDTWVQWVVEWDAAPGPHYVAVRAVDKNGELQIEERAPIAPDGSTGWQRTLVNVT